MRTLILLALLTGTAHAGPITFLGGAFDSTINSNIGTAIQSSAVTDRVGLPGSVNTQHPGVPYGDGQHLGAARLGSQRFELVHAQGTEWNLRVLHIGQSVELAGLTATNTTIESTGYVDLQFDRGGTFVYTAEAGELMDVWLDDIPIEPDPLPLSIYYRMEGTIAPGVHRLRFAHSSSGVTGSQAAEGEARFIFSVPEPASWVLLVGVAPFIRRWR